MRICQAMLARGFGGAERYFVDLSRELARRGHQVLAITHPSGMAVSALRGTAGLELATARSLGTWDPVVVRRLRRLLLEFRPAVVQAHLARAAHHTGKAVAGMHLPVVSKTHNYVNVRYYRHVDLFIPATHDQADYLAGQGIARPRMRVIPNFSVLPAAMPPPDRPDTILAMGRFVRKKGFQILLAALGELRRRGVTLPAVLLAGEGPLRRELQRLARRHGVEESVRWAGWQDDAAAFMDRGTLFVLPSLDEPFGIVLLEAMARGVPIVATLTQGPREILDPGSALLVPPDDSNALADAIAQSLSHPAAARDRAAHASRVYQSRYSAEAVVPQLESLYEELARSAQ
ncbi:MAG: glycosyltransferase [Gammaproteobacteria bacterium]|nr:glycosyltransferase [Gammaproteobacteria bacterium]